MELPQIRMMMRAKADLNMPCLNLHNTQVHHPPDLIYLKCDILKLKRAKWIISFIHQLSKTKEQETETCIESLEPSTHEISAEGDETILVGTREDQGMSLTVPMIHGCTTLTAQPHFKK